MGVSTAQLINLKSSLLPGWIHIHLFHFGSLGQQHPATTCCLYVVSSHYCDCFSLTITSFWNFKPQKISFGLSHWPFGKTPGQFYQSSLTLGKQRHMVSLDSVLVDMTFTSTVRWLLRVVLCFFFHVRKGTEIISHHVCPQVSAYLWFDKLSQSFPGELWKQGV